MSPFICCKKGRVGGRTAIISNLSRTISRDYEHFSRLRMVELNWIRKVSPLAIFRPEWIKKKCVEIRCKGLYYIFLIFVLLHLFQIRHVRNFYCINSKHNFLYSTSFSCTVKVPGMCNFKLHKWTSRSSIKKFFFLNYHKISYILKFLIPVSLNFNLPIFQKKNYYII